MSQFDMGVRARAAWIGRCFARAVRRHTYRATCHDGGVAFAVVDAPPDFRRARRMLALAWKVLPGPSSDVTCGWMGYRPSTPDLNPVIGRSSRDPNPWFAFSHGHLGRTRSAVTGRMIADAMAGRPKAVATAPFRDSRFRGFLAPARMPRLPEEDAKFPT